MLSVGIGVVKSGGVVTRSAARVPFRIDSVSDHDVGVITIRVTRKETARPAVTFCSRQSTLNVFAPAAGAATSASRAAAATLRIPPEYDAVAVRR
jgi:hypothetical protein